MLGVKHHHGSRPDVDRNRQDALLDEHIRAVAAAMPQTLQPSTAMSPASDDSSATILAALNVASAASVAPLTVVAAPEEAQVLAGNNTTGYHQRCP